MQSISLTGNCTCPPALRIGGWFGVTFWLWSGFLFRFTFSEVTQVTTNVWLDGRTLHSWRKLLYENKVHCYWHAALENNRGSMKPTYTVLTLSFRWLTYNCQCMAQHSSTHTLTHLLLVKFLYQHCFYINACCHFYDLMVCLKIRFLIKCIIQCHSSTATIAYFTWNEGKNVYCASPWVQI